MNKFDEIRRIMKNFKGDVDSLVSNKLTEIQTAKARLNPQALEEELKSIETEYDRHFSFTRSTYQTQLNDAIADRRKSNTNKYIPGYIDYDLLGRMNIIAQSGVELTESELSDFCKEAMRSRSEFCIRKCQLMAKDNHFDLSVPSEAKANGVLDEVAKIAGEVIAEYAGELTGIKNGTGRDGHSMMIKVNSSGAFLDRYEKMYEKETVEDVKISQISKKGYEEMKEYKEEQEAERPVELVDVSDSIGIQVKGDNHRSAAGEFARNYSTRMQSSTEQSPEFE